MGLFSQPDGPGGTWNRARVLPSTEPVCYHLRQQGCRGYLLFIIINLFLYLFNAFIYFLQRDIRVQHYMTNLVYKIPEALAWMNKQRRLA